MKLIKFFKNQFISYENIKSFTKGDAIKIARKIGIDFNLENFTILFVLGVYVIFGLLTYFPLEFELFRDPKTLEYGISK